jgi:hypothetical protein
MTSTNFRHTERVRWDKFDKHIIEHMRHCTVLSSHWSARCNRPSWTLNSSLRSIWSSTPLKDIMSYRTLCEHTKIKSSCRLGISAGSKWLDLCPACKLWSHHEGPIIKRTIEGGKTALEALVPTYFAGFDFCTSCKCPCEESPEFTESMLEKAMIQSRREKEFHMRTTR